MSATQRSWESRLLALFPNPSSALNYPRKRMLMCVDHTSPIILTSLFSNSSFIFANAPSSVVHTAYCEVSNASNWRQGPYHVPGVKSAGWLKRIAHLRCVQRASRLEAVPKTFLLAIEPLMEVDIAMCRLRLEIGYF